VDAHELGLALDAEARVRKVGRAWAGLGADLTPAAGDWLGDHLEPAQARDLAALTASPPPEPSGPVAYALDLGRPGRLPVLLHDLRPTTAAGVPAYRVEPDWRRLGPGGVPDGSGERGAGAGAPDEPVAVVDAERERIGIELHDRVIQELVFVRMLAGNLATEADDPERLRAGGMEIEQLLQDVIERTRFIAREFAALHLDHESLATALERLVRTADARSLTSCRFHLHGSGSDEAMAGVLDAAARLHVYRIVQEALSNALRHAAAAHIDVTLETAPSAVVVTVADDGQGPPDESDADPRPHLGTAIMRRRAQLAGGALQLGGDPTGGFVVRFRKDR
jgi:two-component sensor histidine kinase